MEQSFFPEAMIQHKIEEQVAFMEERIEECQAKLLSLEGVTTTDASGVTPAGVEAGAAPMATEQEPPVSSGVTLRLIGLVRSSAQRRAVS